MSYHATPPTQRAVELIGQDELRLNPTKPVFPPGPRQVLCRVEAVGLCFSDLKLVKQFATHPRKSEVTSGLDPQVLAEVPSYVPGRRPTCPGHEAAVRVVTVGESVSAFAPGERYLVQADYRWLPTATANAAFGYNFEGALQEYVLFDERVIMGPDGECALLPAPEKLSASAVALVEPWACVEHAYASSECQVMRGADTRRAWCDDLPADRRRADRDRLLLPEDESWRRGSMLELGQEPNGSLDDILYLGASADEVEQLFPKLASRGRLCVARQGARFHRRVSVPIGRIHYSGLRLTGTAGPPAAELITAIPSSGEIRAGSRVNIVGAGGPMGVMHVVRALCRGIPGITVFAGDLDDARLASLRRLAEPIAGRNGVALHTYHAVSSPAKGPFDYIVIMVPVPALVAQAVEQAAPRAIINLFAGLPVDVTVELDLNAYLDKQLHLIGTSGSTTEDMRTVLHRLESGSLDTDLSVAAVGGLEAALEGIHAVERRQIPGRIVLYPVCRGLQLTRLEEMPETLPHVAALLCDGAWNQHAEEALLRGYEASTGKR